MGVGRQETAGAPGLVVVFNDVCQEAHVLCLPLGGEQGLPPGLELNGGGVVPAVAAEGESLGAEVEHGGEMAVISDELRQLVLLHVENLAYGEGVVLGEGLPLQLLKEVADAVGGFHHFRAEGQAVGAVRLEGGKVQVLLDVDDGVDAEARHALVQPPVDHFINLLAHHRVLPVQVRLLRGEHVEVVQVRAGDGAPGAAAEVGAVVAGGLAVLPLAEVEVIAVLPFRVRQGLLEPLMLVRAVVHHQVHDDGHAAAPGLRQQQVEVLHGAELLCDAVIVGDIVALVHKGGLIDGGEPENVDAQVLQIVQLGQHAPQVANAVAVGVAEALGIDLVGDLAVPP